MWEWCRESSWAQQIWREPEFVSMNRQRIGTLVNVPPNRWPAQFFQAFEVFRTFWQFFDFSTFRQLFDRLATSTTPTSINPIILDHNLGRASRWVLLISSSLASSIEVSGAAIFLPLDGTLTRSDEHLNVSYWLWFRPGSPWVDTTYPKKRTFSCRNRHLDQEAISTTT